MALNQMQLIVLAEVRKRRVSSLAAMSEPMRQAVIGLGMMEPPLIDTLGDSVFVTSQGDAALVENRMF